LGKNKWKGGRKLKVSRPRVRDEEEEVPLPTYEYFKDDDPLKERVLTQILVGVSTRRYERSLETKEIDIPSKGTSKSSVSRRFVAMTTKRLVEWLNRPLEGLDLVVLFIDGVELSGGPGPFRQSDREGA
jgi:transposase-like protein